MASVQDKEVRIHNMYRLLRNLKIEASRRVFRQ